MVRLAIDADAAWRLLRDTRPVGAGVRLVGAAALKSQVLALLYRAARSGESSAAETRALLTRLAELKIRLLGDRVSRATAFTLADELGWDAVGPAEVLAVGVLQADALVSADPMLVGAAEGRIRLASYDELFG